MSNDLKIVLNGEDNGVEKMLKKSLGAMQELGKESSGGADKISKNFVGIEKSAKEVSGWVSRIGNAMGITFGAYSVDRIVEMSRQWAELGAEIRRTSQTYGIGSTQLQGFRTGAKMAGLSADDMTGSIKTLGGALEDALYGRNPELLGTLNTLGVGIKKTKDGAVDTMGTLEEISDVMANNPAFKNNPQARIAFAKKLGISEAILPLIQDGHEKMWARINEGQRWDPARSAESLKLQEDEAQAFRELTGASEHLENVLMVEVAPQLTSFAEGLAQILDRFAREKSFIHEISHPIESGFLPGSFKSFENRVKDLWKHRRKSLGGEGWYRDSDKSKDQEEKPETIEETRQRMLKDSNSASVPGIEGKGVEGMLPLVRKLEGSGDSAVSPKGAIGRYQITPDTARTYGFDPAKLTDPAYNEMAARAILSDLNARYNGNTDAVLAAYNGGPGAANKFLASGSDPSVLLPETQKYLQHAHMIEAEGSTTSAAPQGGAVKVQVDFQNAPPGTKIGTTASGNVAPSTNIAYSMPGNL